MNPIFSDALAWAAQQPPPAAGPGGGGMQGLIFMILPIIILFYFMILRPQKAEQRKREEMINSLGKGDNVITSGGIYGVVESVDAAKGIVTLSVAPKVSMKFSRAAISTIAKKKGAPGGEDQGNSDEAK